MARFKLILQDAAGKTRSATVEAASQAEAVELARRKGYAVRQIEPVFDLADDDGPPAPVETADVGYAFDLPPEPGPSRSRPPRLPADSAPRLIPGIPNVVALVVPTALAGLALLISVVTLIYVLASDR